MSLSATTTTTTTTTSTSTGTGTSSSTSTTTTTNETNEIKETYVNYFAIGSMINPVSINLRDIYPIKSLPAELYGYELVFVGLGGMASIEQKKMQ